MRDYSFHPEASRELTDSIHYYNAISSKLAQSFVEEIEHAILSVRRNPTNWRLIKNGFRRYLVHRFPFGVYYNYDDSSVTIWAIMHLSRNPDYWIGRK